MIAAFVVALALAQQPSQKFAVEKELIEVANIEPDAGDRLMAGDRREQKKVLIAADYFGMTELYKYLAAGDEDGARKLMDQKRAGLVETGIVRVIKVHDYRTIGGGYFAEIRFDEGPYADRTVFTAASNLGLYIERYKELPIGFYARKMEVEVAGPVEYLPGGWPIATITSDLAGTIESGKVPNVYQIVEQGKGVQLKSETTYTVERMTKRFLILKVEIGKRKRDVYLHPKFVRPTDDTVAKYLEGKPFK